MRVEIYTPVINASSSDVNKILSKGFCMEILMILFVMLYSQIGDLKMLEDNLEVDLGNLYSNSYIVYIGIY